MPGECLLRQLTSRPVLHHSGWGKGKWSEKGQQCCRPTVQHGYESRASSSPMEAVGLKPSCQDNATRLSIVQVALAVGCWGREGLAWKNLISVSFPGLEAKKWESLTSRELTSLGCAHRGSAGQTTSKCHQGELNNNHLRDTYLSLPLPLALP